MGHTTNALKMKFVRCGKNYKANCVRKTDN